MNEIKLGKKFPTFRKLSSKKKCNQCGKYTQYALNHKTTTNIFCSLNCFDQFYLDIAM